MLFRGGVAGRNRWDEKASLLRRPKPNIAVTRGNLSDENCACRRQDLRFLVNATLCHTLLVKFEPTSQALLGEQMGNKFLREKGKTQRLVVAPIEQGGLRYKVREMARKISTLAISYWHFPK